MARPGLEPRTPRPSDGCSEVSNVRDSPATIRLRATRDMNREVRKSHEIAGNVGHDVPLVSESPGCGHVPAAARGGASADPGLEEAPLLAKQPSRAALLLVVHSGRFVGMGADNRIHAKRITPPSASATRITCEPGHRAPCGTRQRRGPRVDAAPQRRALSRDSQGASRADRVVIRVAEAPGECSFSRGCGCCLLYTSDAADE